MPSQIVGTPHETVTPSDSISGSRSSGCRCGPGKTIFVPSIAAAYGMPQAFAWNIGTTGRITSWLAMPTPSGMHCTSVCSTCERCE